MQVSEDNYFQQIVIGLSQELNIIDLKTALENNIKFWKGLKFYTPGLDNVWAIINSRIEDANFILNII